MAILKAGCTILLFIAAYVELTRPEGSLVFGVFFLVGGAIGVGLLLGKKADDLKAG
jgi:hypothetical protein